MVVLEVGPVYYKVFSALDPVDFDTNRLLLAFSTLQEDVFNSTFKASIFRWDSYLLHYHDSQACMFVVEEALIRVRHVVKATI